MDRLLVVVFDDEIRADEGNRALYELAQESRLTLFARAIVVKNATGTTGVREIDDSGPLSAFVGTAVGRFIGLLESPLGITIGALSRAAPVAPLELGNARLGRDFIEDVTRALTVNKAALVAEVDEQWTTAVDTRMEALGGTVFRRAL